MDYIGIRDGKQIAFEAKYDTRIHKSGQMVYELYHIRSNNNGEFEYINGWSVETEADYLCYYDIVDSVLYILKMDQLKKYVKCRYLPCKTTNKDKYKTTFFKLISLHDYEQFGYDIERYQVDRSGWGRLKFNA